MQILPQDLLQKYITYAKMHVHPFLHDVDLEKLALVYADLRRESMVRSWCEELMLIA
jgi:DNA replication licensing factor MCM2